MKFLQRNLEEKIIKSVGLIIIFALLFFCTTKIIQYANSYVMSLHDNEKETIEEVNKTETIENRKPLVDPNQPMIALTFDDGPSIYTDELLAILQAHGVRATFFLLGHRVDTYSEAILKMKEAGCEIGSHTYSHLQFSKLLPEQIVAEITGSYDKISAITGEKVGLLRPPYGIVNDVVTEHAGAPIALWSVDTTDWQLKDANAVAQYILATVQDGDVVLLHDIYSSTIEAMRMVVPELKARGYQMVTFSEMATARGVTLQNGQKYFSFH